MKNYYLGLYEKSMPNELSIHEKLIETKKAGFDFMEISIDETDEKLARLKWNIEKRFDIIKAINTTDTNILTMCLSGHRKYPLGSENEEIRNRGMEIMSDAINFAVDLGIRTIQIAGYDEYYKPSSAKTKEFFLENLKIATNMASKKGVILAFETMETEFLNTVKKAMHFINTVSSPYLQIYPDLGNITNAALLYGHKVCSDLESGSGHIVAMHLKETVVGKYREIPFGTGHVDFKSAINTVRNMGVNMFVAEFWYVGNDDWQKQLKNANEFLREKLDFE